MLVEVYALEGGSCRLKRTLSTLVPGGARTLGNHIGERLRLRLFEMCREVEMHGQDFRQSSVREDQAGRAPKREGKWRRRAPRIDSQSRAGNGGERDYNSR
jgi:hypothetical protein